ncbi:MAG: DedA family protein [Actinomycetota bacterium]|nr:DedA family protein [Actinomycetota bacterium]
MTHFLTDTVASNGYLAVLVFMAVGSACIPIPSEIVMVFGGALASSGFAEQVLHDPSKQLSFVAIGLVGVAGTLVGSWAAYAVGYAGGRPLIDRWGRYLLLRPHEVDRAHAWFEDHGEAAVFFSRLIPIIRAFISLPAGVARMSFWRFTVYTVLGSIPWTFGLAGAGYLLGERWRSVETYARPITIAFAMLFVGLVAWWIVRRVRSRGAAAELDAGEGPGQPDMPDAPEGRAPAVRSGFPGTATGNPPPDERR